jgi:hypothetical protein
MQTVNLITDLFKYNTGYLVKHLMPIDKSQLFVRPSHKMNPIIWILGHIVVSRGSLIELMGDEPETGRLYPYFCSGTKPLNDPSEYPHFDDIMGLLGKTSTKLIRRIISGGDSFLSRSAWGDYETIGKNIVAGYIHESYHIGQITYLLSMSEKMNLKPSKLKISHKKDSATKTSIFSLSGLKSVLTVR